MLEPALLFLVAFGPLAFGSVEPWSRSILQVVVFSLPLLAGADGRRPTVTLPRSCLAALGALLVLGAVQALNPASYSGPLPWLPFTASAWHTQKELLLWASYAALLWAAPHGLSEPRRARRFAWAVVLIASCIAAIGLVQAAHGNARVLGFREVPYGSSPFGPYYNNGHAASLLAVAAFMGLGLLASGVARALSRSDRGEPVADQFAVQTLLAFLVAIIVVGWGRTLNRGSLLAFWAAALCVGALSCAFLRKPAQRWGARVALLLVLFGAGAAAVKHGVLRRGAQTSVPVRLSMYRSSLRLLADAPLWGTGLGAVVAVFEPYKEAVVDGTVNHVHNDWLELPLQTGVPVAVALLAALLAFLRRCYQGWTREASLERRLLLGGGLGAALCFLFHAMVEFTWHIPANAVVFLLTLSWLWGQTAARAEVPTLRPVAGKALAGALLVLALLATRPVAAWLLMKGERYEAAYAWDANPVYLKLAQSKAAAK